VMTSAASKGISPRTMITLSQASQEQQARQMTMAKNRAEVQDRLRNDMGAFATQLLPKIDEDAKQVGVKQAVMNYRDVLNQHYSQNKPLAESAGIQVPPLSFDDPEKIYQGLQAAQMSWSKRSEMMLAANKPETPHEARMASAAERRASAAETTAQTGKTKAEFGMTGKGALTPEAVTLAVDQYLAGDNTAAQGYARNAQMKAAFQNRLAERAKEKGMGGEDLAAKVAEFQGFKAGQRSLGTRQAQVDLPVQEAQNLAPLALKASEDLKRTNIRSLNALEQAVQSRTASPELRRLAGATNALINVYARAVSPTGAPTVSDKDHAREVLDKSFSTGDYQAAVDQLMQEMKAAQASPAQVKERMRGEFTGKGGSEPKRNKRYNPDTGRIE
jgi:hypothetical protein